ncbi:MAG: L-seryl-tRNA(Sec) selenium transferase [Deltaproteobacteria bacterium]|nr:L-seryl-tRNA(Sec) selenium transferase [Deltaproteobacteria bacterium]
MTIRQSNGSRDKSLDPGQALLRRLPGVDRLLFEMADDPLFSGAPKSVLTTAIRNVLENRRRIIRSGAASKSSPESTTAKDSLAHDRIIADIRIAVASAMAENLRHTVNATGVVVHTNLGRSLLPESAIRHILEIANGYSNLEFNLARGKRGLRYELVEDIICEVSGAPAAMVVNNNAGAVLLCLDTVAKGREVIVSRGELVEIGGAFRIPDVMAKSGAHLIEVGSTNRTHPKDYRQAICDQTGLLLKVHTSNYGIVGFTSSVSLRELVEIGAESGLPVMEDLGSGTFIDFSRYGLAKEPTVQESVAAGADIVTFSGDKLLGGPQAGIILGKPEIIGEIRKNPFTRALRIDKLTLAALESTLRLFRDEKEAVAAIPTLEMLTCSIDTIKTRAQALFRFLAPLEKKGAHVSLVESSSRAGGGSMPLLSLPTVCVGMSIDTMSAAGIDERMRGGTPAVVGRIEDDLYLMDVRTIRPGEAEIISRVFESLCR